MPSAWLTAPASEPKKTTSLAPGVVSLDATPTSVNFDSALAQVIST